MSDEPQKEIPAHRARIEVSDHKIQKEKERRRKLLVQDLATTFTTPEGRRSLGFIRELCGYGKTCIGGNPALGMDIDRGTLYNAARETIYLELRALLPAYILKDVEFPNEQDEIT